MKSRERTNWTGGVEKYMNENGWTFEKGLLLIQNRCAWKLYSCGYLTSEAISDHRLNKSD